MRLDLEEAHAFLLVPLKEEGQPDHIVPFRTAMKETRFIVLKFQTRVIHKLNILSFVQIRKPKRFWLREMSGMEVFVSKAKTIQEFIWIAQLKQRRALRTAGMIGQQMTRFGF